MKNLQLFNYSSDRPLDKGNRFFDGIVLFHRVKRFRALNKFFEGTAILRKSRVVRLFRLNETGTAGNLPCGTSHVSVSYTILGAEVRCTPSM